MGIGTHGGQKGALDPIKLEWWLTESHHVSAGNRTRVFCKTSKPLEH